MSSRVESYSIKSISIFRASNIANLMNKMTTDFINSCIWKIQSTCYEPGITIQTIINTCLCMLIWYVLSILLRKYVKANMSMVVSTDVLAQWMISEILYTLTLAGNKAFSSCHPLLGKHEKGDYTRMRQMGNWGKSGQKSVTSQWTNTSWPLVVRSCEEGGSLCIQTSVQLPGIHFDTSELLGGRERGRISTVVPPSCYFPFTYVPSSSETGNIA